MSSPLPPMSPAERAARDRARRVATLIVVIAHVGLAVLSLAGRLQRTTLDTNYDTIEWIATTRAWAPLHLIAAGLLVAGIIRDGDAVLLNRALSLSVAFIGVWSFFTLLYNLSARYEAVPLGAPFLGLIVAAFAQALRGSYFPFGPHVPNTKE